MTDDELDRTALADELGQVSAMLQSELRARAGDPMHSVATARSLAALTSAALAALVADARARGITWQSIGDALGTTRQAAFQRFGTPIDPRTGDAMDRTVLADAPQRATAFLDRVTSGRWEQACADFSPAVLEHLGPAALADVWAQLTALGGRLESRDLAASIALDGVTVVEVPLHFEASDLIARISYDAQARIVGLWFVPPAAALVGPDLS